MNREFADLLRGEEYGAVLAQLAERPRPLSPGDALLEAELFVATGQLDEGLVRARWVLVKRDAELSADERVIGHARVITAWGRKRRGELSERAFEAALVACGERPELRLARASAFMQLDRRIEAQTEIERQVQETPGGHAHRLHGEVLYMLGHFDAACRALEKVEPGDRWHVAALRLLAQIHGATGDHAGEAASLRRLLEVTPRGDRRDHDRIDLVVALADCDRIDEARAELTALAAQSQSPGVTRYAERRLSFLAQAGEGAARRVLRAFPSTQQKRNFCGPAVLELCLRYLGIELDQDSIAPAVRRGEGTPMYEITRFLAEQRVNHRRVVMSDDKLKRAIELGLPVILQEEYSTCSHVAVVTGFDDRLGVFVVADPMTHRTGTRPYGWNDHAGELFGCGAVVVLGREGPELEDLVRRASEAGLEDAAHLRLMDEADRMRPTGVSDANHASLEELVFAAERALALAPDFRLAWLRRTRARLELLRRDRNREAQNAFLADLFEVRTRFPHDEWPLQIQGRYLAWEGRSNEAIALFAAACRVDPGDGENLSQMGAQKLISGDLVGAEANLIGALDNHAESGWSESLLCSVYLRELELRNEGDDDEEEDSSEVPWATSRFPAQARTRVARERDDLLFRAEHMNEIARAVTPEDPSVWDDAGFIALARRDLAGAREAFEKASPARARGSRGLACVLEHQGENKRAQELLESVARAYPQDVQSQTDLAALLRRQGEPRLAAQHLESALDRVNAPEDLVRPFYDAFSDATSSEEACARLRELAEARADNWSFLMTSVDRLEDAAWGGHAAPLLRKVVSEAPNAGLMTRLGRSLCKSPFTFEEGLALLQNAVEKDASYYWAARSLALALRGREPERALELAERAVKLADSGATKGYALEVRACLLADLGRREESEQLLERAASSWESRTRGLRALTYFHLYDNVDYPRARELASRLYPADAGEKGYEWQLIYYVRTHRLLGKQADILEQTRALWHDHPDVQDDLAWDVYWSAQHLDPALARAAATVYANRADSDVDTMTWAGYAAASQERGGEAGALRAFEDKVKDIPEALSSLYWNYVDLQQWENAARVAGVAYQSDPLNSSVATAMVDAHLLAGDVSRAREAAERLISDRPYSHAGFERVGIIAGQALDGDAAQRASERATEAAPSCDVAHRSRALACFASGDLERALQHARHSLHLSAPSHRPEARWEVMFLGAAAGDEAAIDRYVATLAPGHWERTAPYLAQLRELSRKSNKPAS